MTGPISAASNGFAAVALLSAPAAGDHRPVVLRDPPGAGSDPEADGTLLWLAFDDDS